MSRSQFSSKFNHDPQASVYDHHVADETNPIRTGYRQTLEWVVRHAGPVSGKTVIDLGCGTGRLSEILGECDKLFCVDISEKMIEQARTKLAGRNVQFVLCDFMEPWSRDVGQVDVVVSTYAIHHLVEPEKARLFEMIAKMLKPGGRAVFGDLMFADQRDKDRVIGDLENKNQRDLIDDIRDEFYWLVDVSCAQLDKAGLRVLTHENVAGFSWGIAAEKKLPS